MLGDGAGVFGLGVFSLAKYNRKSAGAHAASTENTGQATGVDSPGKKKADGDVADELHADGLVEQLCDLGFGFCATGVEVVRGIRRSRCGVDQIPVLDLLHFAVLPS